MYLNVYKVRIKQIDSFHMIVSDKIFYLIITIMNEIIQLKRRKI